MTDYLVIPREPSISASAADIAAHIVDFHRWVDWSPWEGIDPELKQTFSGEPSGVGSVYEWAGNRKAGAGAMTITAVSQSQIDLDLDFTRPFKSASKTKFRLSEASGTTNVTWEVHTPKTLMTRIFGVFMNLDKSVGADLDRGLADLKRVTQAT